MKRVRLFLVFSISLVLFWTTAIAFAQPPYPAAFWTTPNPPSADQEFAATLRILVNPATAGFWNNENPPLHRIDGNIVEVVFDMGCGWLCPPGDHTFVNYPFTMPPLPAGPYVVRFVGSLTSPSPVYAEFNITIGGGGPTPSTALPLGGKWNALLGGVLLLMACLWIRRRNDMRRKQI